MRTIETTITVSRKGVLSGKSPVGLRPGKHRAVIVLGDEDERADKLEPFPDLASFRRSLGCRTYPSNSAVDYREG